MYLIDPEKIKELEFIHLKFPHKFIYGRKNRRIHGNIQVNFIKPDMCVVCGERYVSKLHNVRDKDDLNVYYTKIGLCPTHQYPKPSSLKNFLIIDLIIMLIGIVVFSIILGKQNLIIILTIIGISIPMYLFSIVFAYLIALDYDRNELLKDYIAFRFFSDQTVVSVKNPKWISEFKRFNIWDEIIPILSEFEEKKNEVRLFEKLLLFCLIGLILSIGPIYFYFFMNPIINLERLLQAFIGLIGANIFFLGYYHFKMQPELRELRELAYL